MWGSSLAIGGLLYVKVWIPLTGLAVPCVLHELTGLYCPGCGVTRAATSLLLGDVAQSFRYNSLIWGLLPLFVVYKAAVKARKFRLGNVVTTVMIIAAVAFGLLRNIPQFAWLAPTSIR
jgi:hypothetical protein